MSSSKVPMFIAGTLFVMFSYGIYDYMTGFEENACDMTFMYEYPQFLRVSLPPNITRRFPRYKLYAYGEGVYTEQLRDGKYNGIPVLFVPGNGGSYKQARSVASVAYRRSVDSRLRHHLNVFTVDLAEEVAGLQGRLLPEQARFVAECVRAVLKLYRSGRDAPASVAVIGHSMGGVIARGLYTLPGFDPSLVRHLFLLAAPISEPPLFIDRQMAQFYSSVETFWRARRVSTLKDVTVVSLSGGERDVQVRPHQTAHPSSDVTAVTTSVPGVWASADHQCVVWCRQLVLVLVRALNDLVVPETRQLTSDAALARRVLRHHFVQRTHGKHYKSAFHPVSVPVDSKGHWSQYSLRQWTFSAEVAKPTYLMVPLMANPLYQQATIDVIGTAGRDWLLACTATKVEKGVRMCSEEATNLSGQGQQVPSARGLRRSASLQLEQLRVTGFTHLVVALMPADGKVTVHCDVSRRSDRNVSAEVPAFTSFRSFFSPNLVLDKTEAGALSYNVSLAGLSEPWQAVKVLLKPQPSCGLSAQAALTVHVPWAQESRTVLIGGREGSITAKLQHPRPVNFSATAVPYVTATLDPDCTYSISLQTSFGEIWGQMARYFGPMLPPALLAVLLAALAEQLRAADAVQTRAEGGQPAVSVAAAATTDGQQQPPPPPPEMLSTLSALSLLTPLKLVLPAQMLTSVLRWTPLASRLPLPDFPSLAARGLVCSPLPFLLYFISWSAASLLAGTAWGVVFVIGSVVHKLTSGMLARSAGGAEAVAEVAVAGLARFPVLISLALVALAVSSCGEVALGMGLLVCCVKVLQSYEDLLGGGGNAARLKAGTSLTITLIWLWVTLLHLPCLVVWSKTRSESIRLGGDPSLAVALVLSCCGAVLWREDSPRHDLVGYRAAAGLVNAAGVGVYLFGLVHLYRAGWLAAAALAALALQQLTATVREIPDTEPGDQSEPEEDSAAAGSAESDAQDDSAEVTEEAAADSGEGEATADSGAGESADEAEKPRRRAAAAAAAEDSKQ